MEFGPTQELAGRLKDRSRVMLYTHTPRRQA
jgi:hypothetical protein